MTFDRHGDVNVRYKHEAQVAHNRYLDSLKVEFNRLYEYSVTYEKTVKDFDQIRTLGAGAFGTVRLVRDMHTFEYYAMKAIEKAEVVKKRNIKQLYQERQVLQSVNFPFVIHLEHCCKDNVYVYFLLPFEAGGELFRLIRRLGILSEPLSLFYAAQMVLALEYLHHCSIIHRDVKPENIFLGESGYIKLGDMGFCKVIKTRTWTLCGTPEYLSPEIITAKGYTFAVDWWSLGVLIYEMIAGYPPFYHPEPIKLYEKILSGVYKTPSTMTMNCKTLVRGFLEVDPTKRLGSLKAGVCDIKSHVWFHDLDWECLLHRKINPPYIPILRNPGDDAYFPAKSDSKLKKTSKCQFENDFEHF